MTPQELSNILINQKQVTLVQGYSVFISLLDKEQSRFVMKPLSVGLQEQRR